MSITGHTEHTPTRVRTDDETTTNANADLSEKRLAISCATCGSILPLDTTREWIDREAIECPTCRSVRGIEEVLL